MRKELILNQDSKLTYSQKSFLTVNNISSALLVIFKNHIGIKNKISKNDLFKSLFNFDMKDNLSNWLRWEFVKKAMNNIRKKSKCFIISRMENKIYYFWVLASKSEIKFYTTNLENLRLRIDFMESRAQESLKNKWYKSKWRI